MVAGEAGVAGPVRPELELQRDARGHADGEDEAEDPRPEAGRVAVERVPRPQPQGLHDGQHHPQPMVIGGNRKWKETINANWMRDCSSALMAASPPEVAWAARSHY